MTAQPCSRFSPTIASCEDDDVQYQTEQHTLWASDPKPPNQGFIRPRGRAETGRATHTPQHTHPGIWVCAGVPECGGWMDVSRISHAHVYQNYL